MRNKFVETANVSAFVEAAGSLERTEAGVPGLALVHGMRGLGKTRTAIWYASQNGSVYVRSKALWSPKWMLEELAIELGLTPAKHKKDLFMGVMEELRQRPRLVIIDESNMPPTTCLDAIRDLHDLTENPFLLIGHEGIVSRLKRMGPFFDRFLYITEFKPLSTKDLDSFCRTCMEIPVDEDVIGKVVERTGGNFRKSIVAFKGLENRAKMNGSKRITVKETREREAS